MPQNSGTMLFCGFLQQNYGEHMILKAINVFYGIIYNFFIAFSFDFTIKYGF